MLVLVLDSKINIYHCFTVELILNKAFYRLILRNCLQANFGIIFDDSDTHTNIEGTKWFNYNSY